MALDNGIDSESTVNPLADVNVADISGGNASANTGDNGSLSSFQGMAGQLGYFAAGFAGMLVLSLFFRR